MGSGQTQYVVIFFVEEEDFDAEFVATVETVLPPIVELEIEKDSRQSLMCSDVDLFVVVEFRRYDASAGADWRHSEFDSDGIFVITRGGDRDDFCDNEHGHRPRRVGRLLQRNLLERH